jgi:hypothetical protein
LAFNLLLAALLAVALPAQARLYKWVDDKGQVQYTDTPPPQSSKHAVTEMGKTGQAMKRTESLDERRARETEERKNAEQRKTLEAQARKDKALLATYSKVSEIDLARDRALEHHRLAIKGANTRLNQVLAKGKDLLVRVQSLNKSGKPIPPYLRSQLDATHKEAEDLKKIIQANEEALVSVRARYESDKARYLELTGKR